MYLLTHMGSDYCLYTLLFQLDKELCQERPNSVVKRRGVAQLLSMVLNRIHVSAITNCFKATGLYPPDPDLVDNTKCLEIGNEEEDDTLQTLSFPMIMILKQFSESLTCFWVKKTF